MDCKLMLQETFTHAKQNPPGNFPDQNFVFVTVTIHRSIDLLGDERDVVYYANGPVTLKQEPFKQAILTGDIPAFVNTDLLVELKPKPGASVQLPMLDVFPSNPQLKLRVAIGENGFVSTQVLFNGKPSSGSMGKEASFQTTCNNGLLTAVVGTNSYTLSFYLKKQ